MKKAQSMLLSTALFCTPVIYANETESDDTTIYQQKKTVVTASRYEQSKDEVIPSITIIDRQDLLNLQANDILDVLSLQQGIDVARTGGAGSVTSVFMRGTNSNHTLVLIDGMRVGSSYTGSFSWEHLAVSQVERIEIVRGTRVSYYGSDAIGGVINIITRKQEKLYVRYTGGSFGTQNFDVGFGDSGDKGHYSLILGRQKTDGFSSTNENNSFGFNPDDDPYQNENLNFNAGLNFGSSKLSLSYLESRAEIDFDSFFDVGFSKTQERTTRIKWNGQLFTHWDTEIAFGNNKNFIETRVFSNKYVSDRNSFDFLINRDFNNHHFGTGLTYRDENSDFTQYVLNSLSHNESRKNKAAFVNWRSVFNKNTISISGRYDDNSDYGSNLTGDLDWAINFTDKVRFNMSVGTAFRAPSLNDLNSPYGSALVFSPTLGRFVTFFSYEGNPDLKPEESINYEMGLKVKINQQQDFSFNIFHYSIDNLIDYRGPTFKPVNVFESTINGLEADYNYKKNGFVLNVNATIQDANNDETDSPLLRRPDHKLNLNVDKFFNKFSLGASARYASSSQDFDAELESYAIFNLRASYQVNKNWRVAVKLENVGDENYQLANGYNTPGSSGYFTIEWQL